MVNTRSSEGWRFALKPQLCLLHHILTENDQTMLF